MKSQKIKTSKTGWTEDVSKIGTYDVTVSFLCTSRLVFPFYNERLCECLCVCCDLAQTNLKNEYT